MKYPSLRLVFGVLITASLLGCQRPARLAEPVAVAKACLDMITMSSTNEVYITQDDPRLPDAIRSLRPNLVVVDGQTVLLRFPQHNGLTQYSLTPITGSTNTWKLFGVGPRFNNVARELLRIPRR